MACNITPQSVGAGGRVGGKGPVSQLPSSGSCSFVSLARGNSGVSLDMQSVPPDALCINAIQHNKTNRGTTLHPFNAIFFFERHCIHAKGNLSRCWGFCFRVCVWL